MIKNGVCVEVLKLVGVDSGVNPKGLGYGDCIYSCFF